MRRQKMAGGASEALPKEAEQTTQASRLQLPKEQRKFHKFDPEHPEPEAPRVREGRTPGEQVEDTSPFADYPGGITSEQIAYIRRLRLESSDRNLWLPLGVAVVSFLMVIGAFLAGHATLPKFSAGSLPPGNRIDKPPAILGVFTSLSDGTLGLIDQAMSAERTKDYPKAIEALEQAQRETGHVYGLNYHLATLCYKANDVARVLPLLNLSIADGEEVAACHSFRGLLSGQSGQTDHGPGDLEKATQLDPFNAHYLLVWGEALRHAGHADQALVQFRRALERVQEPALAGGYALKIRLTQIELGQQDQFAAEMAAQLKLSPPPVAWLLTVAAVEMHRNNLPAAAEALNKVYSLIGGTATALQLQDPFFVGFAHESELARFFEVSSSADSLAAP